MIIFTDLDGTLLDPDYTCHNAQPAIRWIEKQHHQLIFVTSKTRSEVLYLQQTLGVEVPFITENGGGVFFPPSYRKLVGALASRSGSVLSVQIGWPYTRIRRFFDAVKSRFGLSGFCDFSDRELGRITGLSAAGAARARRRDYSEPFLMADESKLGNLKEVASLQGLKIVRGGRFFHLCGQGNDKGKAALWVKKLIDPGAQTVALGDAENDANMLRSADIAIQIPCQDGSFPKIGDFPVHRARWPGSRGWNDAILSMVKPDSSLSPRLA